MDELRLMLQSQLTNRHVPPDGEVRGAAVGPGALAEPAQRVRGGALGHARGGAGAQEQGGRLGENLRVSEAKCVAVETELGETKGTLVKTSRSCSSPDAALRDARRRRRAGGYRGKLTGEADEEGAKLEKSAADLEGIFDRFSAQRPRRPARAVGGGLRRVGLESAAFLKARTEDLQATVKVTAADLETTWRSTWPPRRRRRRNHAPHERERHEADGGPRRARRTGWRPWARCRAPCRRCSRRRRRPARRRRGPRGGGLGREERARGAKKLEGAVHDRVGDGGRQRCRGGRGEHTATFVAAHCVSLDAAREAHAAESKTTCDGLAAHVAAVRTFASGQRDELLALAAAVAQQREGTATAAAEVLAAEQAAASERAVLGSKELQAATDGFAADAEALMQQMAVALGALKQKHADVLSEAAVANSSRITTGAETHAGAMNKMFLEHDAAATEATETQAKEMAAGLSAFEESAGDAMSVSTAAVQASNSTLSEAMGGLKQSAQNFAQETSVETTASADATKQTLMDLNESCTHAAGECNALGTC